MLGDEGPWGGLQVQLGWEGGSLDPEEAARGRLRVHSPRGAVLDTEGVFLPALTDIFKHFVFTRSDFGALFLGKKEITGDVTLPHPTQPRSLPVKLVFRALLLEVEKADTRFSSPILGKEKQAPWHGRLWRLFPEGDGI